MSKIKKESVIGGRVKKFDAPDKASGKTRYIHDMNLPNQLVGMIYVFFKPQNTKTQ